MKTEKQQAKAAEAFALRWKGRGYEKGESQVFWTELVTEVFGVENPSLFLQFEQQAKLDHTSFIDVMIPSTRVMIEQKSLGKDLRKTITQADGTKLTPFQQAQRYAINIPVSQHPRWIVTCNFAEFDIYDMENPNSEPQRVELCNLGREYYRLRFLVETGNEHLQKEFEVSMKAGEIVGKLYDAFIAEYGDNDPETLRCLNVLCVRLVFCLYAEDAGVFGRRDIFHDYMAHYATEDMRDALMQLFKVLNTPIEKRSRFMKPELAAFPYTNGGLFAEEIDVPPFTDETRSLLLQHASLDFDWSMISPTIFGGLFESTLNPETRRKGGMHYTSIENIHKVIDPLFLDDLRRELDDILEEKVDKTIVTRLNAFRDKLASLTFFDPACGSGNFLTETYLSLRRLENRAIFALCDHGYFQTRMFESPIKVSINQFYGIEINDFAVTVATTALWISEAQMLAETERIVGKDIDFLPLKSYANIHEGNALATPWESVIEASRLSYIIGNPPFIGARMMEQGSQQKMEVENIFGKIKNVHDLDYVCCWFKKAAQMMQGTTVKTGFVATNSICQGSQVPVLWNVLLNDLKIVINFAYQTFKWSNESTNKAAVHCVIVGFSCGESAKGYEKKLFSANGMLNKVKNISPYLFEGSSTFITSRNVPICDVPYMNFGNQPRDGGHFILTEEEKNELLHKDSSLLKWIRQYYGAEEFLKGKKRYCFWLKNASPAEIKQNKILYNVVSAVQDFRLSSSAKTTQGYAKVPNMFAQITQPEGVDCIIIPRTSSEKRRYIPIGFLSSNAIASDAVQLIPNATLYHFGVLQSNVHMAWIRTVCGRLEMRYRYSKEVVYNNFLWPEADEAAKKRIEQTAQAILDARALYPDSSLAELYDPVLMPTELREAHRQNDRAVMAAYGFSTKITESECVAALFNLFTGITTR